MALESTTLEQLFAQHSGKLRAFFKRRLNGAIDSQDLVQEVYLRMLRVNDSALILNPEAYLYTVASNLLKEQAVLQRRHTATFNVFDDRGPDNPADAPSADEMTELNHRAIRLNEVLGQLSPKCRAVVLLRYRDALSYQQIAARLAISDNMVKKYLAQALAHCRKRMASWS